MRLTRTIAASCILFLFAQGASATGLIPKKGGQVAFSRIYSADYLKERTLQRVKKTDFSVKNANGMLVGTWKATFRDLRNDEEFTGEASGICRPRGRAKLECAFHAEAGTLIVSRTRDGVTLSVPDNQGVHFDERTEDGFAYADSLLGEDADNNFFRLNAKKSKR